MESCCSGGGSTAGVMVVPGGSTAAAALAAAHPPLSTFPPMPVHNITLPPAHISQLLLVEVPIIMLKARQTQLIIMHS